MKEEKYALRGLRGSPASIFSKNAIMGMRPGPAITWDRPVNRVTEEVIPMTKTKYVTGMAKTNRLMNPRARQLRQETAHHTAIPIDGQATAMMVPEYTTDIESHTATA